MEGRIAAEQNTLIGLRNELAQIQRELWANPRSVKQIDRRLSVFPEKISGRPKRYADAGLDQWFGTLPFPLASILRAWQATSSREPKAVIPIHTEKPEVFRDFHDNVIIPKRGREIML
jgi:hypothetical protein